MTDRTSLVAAFALGAFVSAAAIWSARPGVAQPRPEAAVEAGEPGRYRIAIANTGTIVFVIDSATGQCWRNSGSRNWIDIGSPVSDRD